MSDDPREELEMRADQLKQSLLEKVDLIEKRKDALIKTVLRARAWSTPIAVGAAAVTVTAGIAYVVTRQKKRPPSILNWSLGPTPQPKRRGVLSRVSEELLYSGATMVGTRLLQIGVERFLGPPTHEVES